MARLRRYLPLGRPGYDNEMLEVIITELPLAGTLYQAAFASGSDPTYSSIASDMTFDGLVSFTADGESVTDERGLVMYNPALNEFNSALYTTFKYAFVDTATGVQSDSATVNLVVNSVNDAPEGTPLAVTCPADGSIVIALEASDVDEDPSDATMYAPSGYDYPFAYISTFPSFGSLSQVDAVGNPTTSINGDDSPASTFAWASEVVRYSSAYSLCGSSCFPWANADCNLYDPGTSSSVSDPQWSELIEYWGDGTCYEFAWQANQILGEPNFYPSYGDSKLGWDLSEENWGHEWIELRFSTSMYISKIELYETSKPGAV